MDPETFKALRAFASAPREKEAEAVKTLRTKVREPFAGAEMTVLESRLAVVEGVAKIRRGSNEQVMHAQHSLARDHPCYPKSRGSGMQRSLLIPDDAWTDYCREAAAEAESLRKQIRELESRIAAELVKAAFPKYPAEI